MNRKTRMRKQKLDHKNKMKIVFYELMRKVMARKTILNASAYELFNMARNNI
jgi:hypothetical protein